MNDQEITSRFELARQIAHEAGQLTLEYFCQDNFEVELKADLSPVTVADRRAEQHLRDRIEAAFPKDGVLGEEFGEWVGTTGYRWILDPIDGTKSFVHGVPMYGTMVAVEREARGVIGVVYVPGVDEVIAAAVGQGAWYSRHGETPRRAKVSSRSTLSDSSLLTTELSTFTKFSRREAFEELEAQARLTRTWGDCYGYMLVAIGRADCMIDPAMNVWDAAALQPIMEEAGGTFTDWQGEPTIHSGEGMATNGKLLEEILTVTRKYPLIKRQF